jgi:hypothetical protein
MRDALLFFTLDKREGLIPEGLGIAEKTKEKFLTPVARLYECMDGYTISTVYILTDGYLYLTRRAELDRLCASVSTLMMPRPPFPERAY